MPNLETHRRDAGNIGTYDMVLEVVQRRKVIWVRHDVIAERTMANTLFQSKVEGKMITRKAIKKVVE